MLGQGGHRPDLGVGYQEGTSQVEGPRGNWPGSKEGNLPLLNRLGPKGRDNEKKMV